MGVPDKVGGGERTAAAHCVVLQRNSRPRMILSLLLQGKSSPGGVWCRNPERNDGDNMFLTVCVPKLSDQSRYCRARELTTGVI